jgi:hypothetical protein
MQPSEKRHTATGAARIAVFAAVLAGVFAAAAVAGGAIDPKGPDPKPTAHGDDGMRAAGHAAMAADPVRGLAVAEHGLQLVVDRPALRRAADERLRFRIVDARGAAVRDFDVEHEKRMHLIVARRDLTGFQHLHPTMAADGTWSTPIRIAEAGSYRMFADFSHGDEATTLGSDLRVDGAADLRALPAPAAFAHSDGGYDVRLGAGSARPGKPATLRFTVSRDGKPIHVEPYLGANGHLVALREGDLAFLHVHPNEHSEDDAIAFEATFPTTGRYRLFLQFKHEGRVQTAAFTQEVR